MNRWIRRRQGMDVLPVVLQRRRLYILPTRAGMAYGALLLLMLVAGLNYANSLGLLAAFLLAGLALVAMHACHRNLLGLTVAELTSQDSFAGAGTLLQVHLGNGSAQPRIGIELDGTGAAPVACVVVANGDTAVPLHLATPRRGVVPVERLRIMTTWPFGLFRTWTWLHVDHEVIVYPAPAGTRPPPVAAGTRSALAPRSAGELDEWSTLRAFRDGDSPRQVAWKAYARGAPLLVKEYSASGSSERLYDFSQLTGLTTEERLSQLTRWILDAEAAGERFGLRLPGLLINMNQGAPHRQRCLRALALYAPGGPGGNG